MSNAPDEPDVLAPLPADWIEQVTEDIATLLGAVEMMDPPSQVVSELMAVRRISERFMEIERQLQAKEALAALLLECEAARDKLGSISRERVDVILHEARARLKALRNTP